MAVRPLRRLGVLVVLALATALLPAVVTTPAGAAVEPGSPFTRLGGFSFAKGERARVTPRDYTAYRLDLALVAAMLAQAPTRSAVARGAAPLVLTVPDPAGRLQRFGVQEDSVMQRGLRALHPDIHTYAGRGLDDPTRTIRLDLTPMGFHASVRSPGGGRAWYVDPAYNRRGTTTHLSYYGSTVAQPDGLFVERDLKDTARAIAAGPTSPTVAPGAEVLRRTFRLAFVTDPSYAAYFGTANVLAEKATLVNRVNQIYNDDLAVDLVLVDGTDELNLDTTARATGANGPCGAHGCYDPADLDPVTGGCSGALLGRNEFVLGQIIGADAYDIGHIGLGINGGGIAGLGVVGGPYKADGCTGLPFPQGDFYAIDYVAHEMGHQFGGNHTFNGSQVNCSLTNRNGGTSVEPGSGSSVMAYAGICGQDDLQPHTDPYFSQRSIEEITDTVTASPRTGDEQQVVNLAGYDASGEAFQLTYPGASPVTITRGAGGTYHVAGIALAVQQLTGVVPEVSGYDGAASPGTAGFTLDFSTVGSGTDLDRFGVVGGAGVTGFVGTTYDGGPGTNQGAAAGTGNHAPAVTAPADRTLPIRTPFTLTGSATDADDQALSYLWEQDDTGNGSPTGGTALVSNTKADGPLFRVFGTAAQVSFAGSLESPSPGENLADGSASRTFPDLAQILAGHTNAATGACPAAPADTATDVPADVVDCFSEFLPTADYADPILGGELSFRLTARDGFATGGGTSYDDVVLTLDSGAGPFLVTSRATAGQPAVGGDPETVTWAVNGTDAAGLAPNVRITLSTDGGHTFPHVLADSTPNDGTEVVTLPIVGTDSARIRIEAVDNYFFDIGDADFTITSPLGLSTVADQQVQYSDPFAAPVVVTAESDSVDGDQLAVTVSGVDGLSLTPQSTSPDGVRPGQAVFLVEGDVTEAPGAHTATLTVTEPGVDSRTTTDTFAVAVTPEDAAAAYSGPTEATAPRGSPAGVVLEATVTDATDGHAGDISRATVTFVDRATGEALCTAPVTGGPDTGSATCTAELAGLGDSTTYAVGTVVAGDYARDDPADDATVTVSSTQSGDTTAPHTSITAGPAAGAFVLARNIVVRFASTEGGSTYACSLDGAAVGCSDGRKRLRRLSAGTHVFRVAARDASGNLDPTPARRLFATPFGVRRLHAHGTWTSHRDRAAYRGRYLSASSAGAVLARRAGRITGIALVAGTGPGLGRVAVFLAGERVGTVSLDARRSHARALLPVASFGRPRSGVVMIRTLDRRPVRIEGLGVLSRP